MLVTYIQVKHLIIKKSTVLINHTVYSVSPKDILFYSNNVKEKTKP